MQFAPTAYDSQFSGLKVVNLPATIVEGYGDGVRLRPVSTSQRLRTLSPELRSVRPSRLNNMLESPGPALLWESMLRRCRVLASYTVRSP